MGKRPRVLVEALEFNTVAEEIAGRLSATRYSERPFPRYRFVPRRHPHPTAHPEGHSYVPPGSSHPEETWYPPDRWRESDAYRYGCDLYNHGYWWEAHEAWEGLWQVTDKRGTQGYFLQGLIQVSACHLKLLLQSARGVEHLRTGFRGYLQRVLADLEAPCYMGLNLAAFFSEVESYFESQTAGPPATWKHEAATYPYVCLKMEGG